MESTCSDHGGLERDIRCLDSARLQGRINKLLVALKQRGLDLETHCGRTSCYLLWHLPVLNKTLYEAAMQLIEHSPGAFTLSAIPSADVDVVRSDSSLMEAAILLYWLLKHHHCIRRLVLSIKAFPVSHFPALLSEALMASKGVMEVQAHPVDMGECWWEVRECSVLGTALGKVSLRLECLDVTPLVIDHNTAEAIASAVRRGNLHRLVLGSEMSITVAKKLFFALTASASLRSLEIAGFTFSKSNAVVLAAALKHNKTLQKVSLKNIEEDVVGIILASMAHNDTLKELCLAYSVDHSRSTLWDGLQALRANTGLGCVKITRMTFKNSFAIVIADILRENSTLEELSLSCNRIENTGGRALAKALNHNSRLRRLDVSDNQFLGGELVQYFVDALAVNETLEYVRLGFVHVDEEWAPSWPATGNVHARLHVTWNTCVLEGCAERLREDDRLPRLYVGWTKDASSSSIVQWFSAACLISASLTELTIECPQTVESTTSAVIVSFLEATNYLKKLVVRPTSVSCAFVTDVIIGLARNKSVCDVVFHQKLHHDRDVKALRALFHANRTLHRIMFSEYWLDEKAARLLARALEDNFVLLTLEFEQFVARVNMFPLLCVLNRNRSFLNRAVECVLGAARDSRSVGAVELLSACDSLLVAVSDASGKSREESKCLVLEAVRRQNSSSHVSTSEPR